MFEFIYCTVYECEYSSHTLVLHIQANVYKNYVEKIRRQQSGTSQRSPCCPLCARSFQKKEESEDLVDTLQQRLEASPNELRQVEAELSSFEKQQQRLLESKSLITDLNALSTRVDALRAETGGDAAAEKSAIRTQLEGVAQKIRVHDSRENRLRLAHNDLLLVDQNLIFVKEKNEEIVRLRASLPAGMSKDRTLF